MGTQSKEQFMNELEELTQRSLDYKDVIHEYCTLSVQPALTDTQAERLAEILQKSQSEPLLSFWIDEADHILAHALGLLNKEFVEKQQCKLEKKIDSQLTQPQSKVFAPEELRKLLGTNKPPQPSRSSVH